MNNGEKVICKYDHWFNGFGQKQTELNRGMKLTVKGRKAFAGAFFYRFEETPDDSWYLTTGFTELRNYN